MCPGCKRPWVTGWGCTMLWCPYYGVEAEEKGADDNDEDEDPVPD